MKNAILISGGPGTGKPSLAAAITKFKLEVRGRPSNDFEKLALPGVQVITIENVTKLHQILKFLPFISMQPILFEREGEDPYEVSPFFIFISSTTGPLSPVLARHIGHFQLEDWQTGQFVSDEQDLPYFVVSSIVSAMKSRSEAALLPGPAPVKNRG